MIGSLLDQAQALLTNYISQGPKSLTDQLGNGNNSMSVRAEVLLVQGMEILGNTESTLSRRRSHLWGKHEKFAVI